MRTVVQSLSVAAVAIVAVGGLAGCAGGLKGESEFRNYQLRGEVFRKMAIIASGTRQQELQMTVRVMARLNEGGWEVNQPGGLWPTETSAVDGVCADAESAYDGVIFVAYNRIKLFECETQAVAYSIEGEFIGVDDMTGSLIGYLEGRPPS